MGAWHVDSSNWPIVVQSVEGTLSDAEVDALIRAGTEAVMRGESYVAILDASKIGHASAYLRARSVEWQRTHREALRQHCLGTAYILSSPLMRFVAMTVLMVTNLPTPCRVFDSEEEALAWAHAQLRKAQAVGAAGPRS